MLVAALLVGVALSGTLRADLVGPLSNVPMAQENSASVIRGFSVDIVLEGVSSRTDPIHFLIRKKPAHGTVSEPRQHPNSKHKAIVTYTSRVGPKAGSDTFHFAVKHLTTTISKSVPVNIQIAEPRPQVRVGQFLDFGNVPIGSSAVRELFIENIGSATYSGKLVLPKSVALVGGSEKFTVAAGKHLTLKLVYTPREPKVLRHPVVLQQSEGGAVTLLGGGTPPFVVTPGAVDLVWDAARKARGGTITIANTGSALLELALAADSRLQFPAKVVLTPGGEQEVRLYLPIPDKADFAGALKISSTIYSDVIPLSTGAVPAYLRWIGHDETGIDFGDIAEGKPSKRTLVVRNIGGTETGVSYRIEGSFEVEGLTQGVLLPPDQQLEFTVSPKSGIAGRVRGSLVVSGAGVDLPLDLQANFGDAKLRTTVPVLVDTASAAGEPEEEEEIDLMTERDALVASLGVLEGDYAIDKTVPVVNRVYLKENGKKSIVLGWFPPASGQYTYKLFVSELRGLKTFWVPCRNSKVEIDSKVVLAQVTELKPFSNFGFRVMTLDSQGKSSLLSPKVVIETEPPLRLPWKWIVLGISGTAAASLIGVKWWRGL